MIKIPEIIRQRLINQKIIASTCKDPADVVHWMVAMQAQEFAMAKWAIGLRLPESNEDDIDKSFNEGHILRTHLLRPTWHFVTPMDIRWLLALTAPHINAASAYYHRQAELDHKTFARANDILAKTLEGGNHFTRAKLQAALNEEKINASGLRLAYIMMVAELDGVICSGPRQGNQFTYALLEERAPVAKKINRDEALALLTKRFFASRGPATIQDLAYWSGLTLKEIKSAVAALPSNFEHETIDNKEYIFIPIETKNQTLPSFLMPDYDEYGMSYKDRQIYSNKKKIILEGKKSDPVFNHIVVVRGIFGGTWERKALGNKILIDTKLFEDKKSKLPVIETAKKKYLKFFKKK